MNIDDFVKDFKDKIIYDIDDMPSLHWSVPMGYDFMFKVDGYNLKMFVFTKEFVSQISIYLNSRDLLWCGLIETEVLFNKFTSLDILEKFCTGKYYKYCEYQQDYANGFGHNWLHDLFVYRNSLMYHYTKFNDKYKYIVQLSPKGSDVEIKASVQWNGRLYKVCTFWQDIKTTQQRRSEEMFRDLVEYTLEQQETQYDLAGNSVSMYFEV